MFAGHARHDEFSEAPVDTKYVPAAQFVHVSMFVAAVAPEYVPAAQSVQVVCPVVSAYLPAPQAEHAMLAPAVDEDMPAAQFTHVPSPFI